MKNKRSRVLAVISLLVITIMLISTFRISVNAKEVVENDTPYVYVEDAYNKHSVKYVVIDSEYKPTTYTSSGYESLKSIVEKSDAPLGIGINAGAWNSKGSLNYTYQDNEWLSVNKGAYVGDPLVYTKDDKLIAYGYNGANISTLSALDPEWILTGYNGVIYDTYYENRDWNTKHDRSFIGRLNNGDFVIGVMKMATYSDMIDWARSIWGYDIELLYNLDGGGSCSLYIDDTSIYAGRNIKNAIIF